MPYVGTPNFLSGTTGSVQIGSQLYRLGKWKLAMNVNLPKVNNFSSQFQQLVVGLAKATLTIEGPYDATNMGPLQLGGFGSFLTPGTPTQPMVPYVFTLGFIAGITLTVTAFIQDMVPDNDIDGSPRVSITAESTGSFTAQLT